MPSFEKSTQRKVSDDSQGGVSYDKLFSVFYYNTDTSIAGRSKRIRVSLKNSSGYENAVARTDPALYKNIAGSDLSAIFMPFQSMVASGNNNTTYFASGVFSGIPCFSSGLLTGSIHTNIVGSGIGLADLLPFFWDKNDTGNVYDRNIAPSGDGISDLISGENYYGDSDRYRKNNNIRGVGLRLPLMGVGWGYDTNGAPFPPGRIEGSGTAVMPSGGQYFKGDCVYGHQVDPVDYVAAPIDIRYDLSKNVWTTVSNSTFLAQLTNSSGVAPRLVGAASGYAYSWTEMQVSTSGFVTSLPGGRTGIFNAFEINSFFTPLNTVTTMQKSTTSNAYLFKYDLPPGVGRYKVLMILDDTFPGRAIWDYPRFHGAAI